MPRIKKMKVVYTFPSTVQALKIGLDGRLIPVPKQISAGCGMAWAALPEARASLEELILGKNVEIEGVYELLL